MILYVDMRVNAAALPAVVTVADLCGEVLYRAVVRRGDNRFCLRVRRRNIMISVRPLNGAFNPSFRYFKFGCARRARLSLDFRFDGGTVASEQTFYLYDENYLFPVASALMNFNGVS